MDDTPSSKPDEVWAQVGDGPRRKVGTSRFRPNTQWCKDHRVDTKKIVTIVWSEMLSAWIIKMKP